MDHWYLIIDRMNVILVGYISKVLDKERILLRIDNGQRDKLLAIKDRTGHSILMHYQTTGIYVKVSTKWCSFDLTNLNWNSVEDLVGVEIYCSCKLVPYCFETPEGTKKGTYLRAVTIRNT